MGKVVFDMTASLDGFVAGRNDSVELPMGEGGLRLFDWYFAEAERSRAPEDMEPEIREQAMQVVGVVVSGRRTYNHAQGWNGQHPIGVPVVVVTHEPPQLERPFNGQFVTEGVARAIEQAQATAGDKMVAIASPSIARQCLELGLLDELSIHVAPVLLGGGVRMFDHLGVSPIELECTQASNAGKVVHLTYRVLASSEQ